MKPCIIFDIDGTVANLQHRVHHVQGGRKDWKAFFKGIPDDLPIDQTIYLNWLLHKTGDYPIFMCSGRSEDERGMTETWLLQHYISYKQLFLRPAGDYRPDHIIKKEMLDHIRSLGYEPWLIFDDRPAVVDMWRENGCFVLQADPDKNFTHHHSYKFAPHIPHPLIVMVGPSGAGKSTWIENNIKNKSSIISSDQIREDLCGDFQDQSKNVEVFRILHDLASHRLKNNLPVVIDATNIRRQDRMACAKLAPEDINVQYIVVNRPLKEKLVTAGWRSKVSIKGKTLVQYHDEIFNCNLKDIMNGDGLTNVAVTVI